MGTQPRCIFIIIRPQQQKRVPKSRRSFVDPKNRVVGLVSLCVTKCFLLWIFSLLAQGSFFFQVLLKECMESFKGPQLMTANANFYRK